MKPCIVLCLLAGTAAADDGVALHSQVGFGTTVVPDRIAVTTEGGYVGGAGRFEGHATVDATLLPGLSVFASARLGDENEGQQRPAIGAAYQFTSPLDHAVGVRLSVAYKSEGFNEPEGEIESSLVLSHMIGRDVVRTALTAGSDADGREGDVEFSGGYLHRASERVVLGLTTHYRQSLVATTMPRWDMLSGALGDYAINGRWRLELLAGVGTAQGRGSGPAGLMSVGIDL